MSDGNSGNGILSVDDAVAQILGSSGANPQDEDQAAPDAEVDEVDETEVDDTEEDTDDTGDEEEADDQDPGDDADTDEDEDPEEVKRGQMRQADYTRKTQELAREKAEFAAQREQFKTYAEQQLAQLQAAVQTYAVPTEVEPNWPELARTRDPKEYQKLRAEWDDKQVKQRQAAEINARITEQQEEQQRQREESLLYDRLPEWRDETIKEADVRQIVALAQEYNVSVEEVANIKDHRQVLMLRDLAKARRSQEAVTQKKAKVRKKVTAPAAPVAKTAPQEKVMRDRTARLQKTGSPDDAVAMLLARYGAT